MKKKRRWPFDDDFFDVEKDFERMREEMEKVMERMFGSFDENEVKRLMSSPSSKVYGFSIRLGPEGRPVIREFGNVKPKKGKKEEILSEEREPLVDIIEGKEEISVIAEVPGVEKKDIDIRVSDNKLTIHVDTKERKYHKELDLKCTVDPSKVKATYKNGVLEIIIKKTEKRGNEEKEIRVE